MLKFLLLIFISFPALACLLVQGSLSVDGENWKIHQKMEPSKEYALPMGNFILSMTVTEGKKHSVKYKLEEKKGLKLDLVTVGEEELEDKKAEDIFAKGKPEQPNSIINLKITKQ